MICPVDLRFPSASRWFLVTKKSRGHSEFKLVRQAEKYLYLFILFVGLSEPDQVDEKKKKLCSEKSDV